MTVSLWAYHFWTDCTFPLLPRFPFLTLKGRYPYTPQHQEAELLISFISRDFSETVHRVEIKIISECLGFTFQWQVYFVFFSIRLFPQNKTFKLWLEITIKQISISSYDIWTCIILDLQVGKLDLRRNKEHIILKKFRAGFFQGSGPSFQISCTDCQRNLAFRLAGLERTTTHWSEKPTKRPV